MIEADRKTVATRVRFARFCKNGRALCKSCQTAAAWRSSTVSPFFDVRKRSNHACTVCTLLQKLPNGCCVATPFMHSRKRDCHSRTVCTVLQERQHGSSVASLFNTSGKRDVALQPKSRVCKNCQTAAAWRSLFQPCTKGITTLQPFGYFCKHNVFAAAVCRFCKAPKKVLPRGCRLAVLAKACKPHASGGPFFDHA